jgi:hypothetical protein
MMPRPQPRPRLSLALVALIALAVFGAAGPNRRAELAIELHRVDDPHPRRVAEALGIGPLAWSLRLSWTEAR